VQLPEHPTNHERTMIKPDATNPFRLRPAALGGATASSSMLRVARNAAVARAAPVLQSPRAQRQLSFDFHSAAK
jgi:hypothetical protein